MISCVPADFMGFFTGDDRCAFLENRLSAQNIPYAPIVLNNSRHLYVQFPLSSYNPHFKIKTLLVHYDCAPDSVGANDNGAAVCQTFAFVERLWKSSFEHNMRVFFTDGEELGSGVEDQGAFSLATLYKKIGITTDDVYVLDCCGRGDVLILSTAGKNRGTPKFKDRFDDLFARTSSLAKKVSPEKWITAPVPYGDNAGFVASGIPAVALTVLPQSEASDYVRRLHNDRKLETAIMNHLPYNRDNLPLSWRMIHSEYDTVQSLTPDAFALMERFLVALAKNRTPA